MGIALVAAAVVGSFLALVAVYARAQLWKAALGSVLWMAAFGVIAAQGLLARFDARPPPFFFMFLSILIVGVLLGRSQLLARIPAWLLIALQSFRLPLELVMHALAKEGVMPNEMSFTGYNFDIVTGISAIGVAYWVKRTGSRRVALAWNVLGSILLFVVVTIAVLASPIALVFGPGVHANTFVAYFPYVYLPTVCVLAAFATHVAIFRAPSSA